MKEIEKDTFPSDSEIAAIDNINSWDHQDVENVTFTEEELRDPHFKESNMQISLNNMFLQKPFLGMALSVNAQIDLQSWLLQMIMENQYVNILERHVIEDLIWTIQNILKPDESFYFTQALIEIALQKSLIKKLIHYLSGLAT